MRFAIGHNLAIGRIVSSLWHLLKVSICVRTEALGSYNHWNDMLKMAARRAILEALDCAFVSWIRVFLILLDHPQSCLLTPYCWWGHWRPCLGKSLNTRQLWQTQSSPSWWGWLHQARRGHNALVKVWWIAPVSTEDDLGSHREVIKTG
jgi:hypothetical protein